MREYTTSGTCVEMWEIEAQAAKEMKVGERCRVDGELYERIRIIVGNGWQGKPLMRIWQEDDHEKR